MNTSTNTTTQQQPVIEAGTWLNGTWLNGTWLNGTWLNGTWLNTVPPAQAAPARIEGDFEPGLEAGTWYNGTWYNGTWYNGTWYNGTWYNSVPPTQAAPAISNPESEKKNAKAKILQRLERTTSVTITLH